MRRPLVLLLLLAAGTAAAIAFRFPVPEDRGIPPGDGPGSDGAAGRRGTEITGRVGEPSRVLAPGRQAAAGDSRWQEMVVEKGPGFTLFYSGRKRLEFEGELLALLQRERDDLSLVLGVRPRRDLEVIILTPDLGEKGERPDPSVGAIYDGRIRLFLGEGRPDPRRLQATVRHELIHALLFQVSLDLPAWLQEGLAQKLGERVTDEMMVSYRTALMQETDKGWWVPPLSLKGSIIGLHREDRARAYALCLLFVDFLDRRYGGKWLPRLLAALEEGKSLEEASREVTGASPDEWETAFEHEMGRR